MLEAGVLEKKVLQVKWVSLLVGAVETALKMIGVKDDYYIEVFSKPCWKGSEEYATDVIQKDNGRYCYSINIYHFKECPTVDDMKKIIRGLLRHYTYWWIQRQPVVGFDVTENEFEAYIQKRIAEWVIQYPNRSLKTITYDAYNKTRRETFKEEIVLNKVTDSTFAKVFGTDHAVFDLQN